jgi:hypothetical protein
MRIVPSLLLTLALAGGATPSSAAEPAPATTVHDIVIRNVYSESQLLAHMEDIGRMDGMTSVDRLDLDRSTNEARVRLTMLPAAEKYWRAWIETHLRKVAVNVPTHGNDRVRSEYPDWFPRDPVARRLSLPEVGSESQAGGLCRLLERCRGVRSVTLASWESGARVATFEVSLDAGAVSGWDDLLAALNAARGLPPAPAIPSSTP